MIEPDGVLTVDEARCRARVGAMWSKHGPEVVPAGVADMDFDPPAPVLDALRVHLDRGDLGCGPFAADLGEQYVHWQERQHGWRADVGRVRAFTSALHALEVSLWNTTERGDGVVVSTPVGGSIPIDSPRRSTTPHVILFCNPPQPDRAAGHVRLGRKDVQPGRAAHRCGAHRSCPAARCARSHARLLERFGANGARFARINIASSEQILDQVIDRIADAVDTRS